MENIFGKLDISALMHILEYDQYNPLLFNTGLFLWLFLGFLVVYQVIQRWNNFKMVFVILFSLYFYYKSSEYYCLILLGMCLSDYVLGRLMGICRRVWIKRLIVSLNVVSNVGMLVYFKYFNLLYETFASLGNMNFDPLDIVLPAGISFFTFRSISYMVDIYRGDTEPERNFLHYTFSLTFFPPLLAGPVVRAKDILPQIKCNRVATRAMVGEGLFLIMSGLIKKVMIADYISGNFVDRIFDNPALYSGFENVIGSIGFSIQLYCDFSGYSDMAIGLALLLGFRFKDNFNSPYKSQNPSEFWHRWHISLSTWLRDYIYIPLGGNRKGRLRTNLNLMSTMLIGGLWHGASWMYLLWGAYNGLLLVVHKMIHGFYRLPERCRDRWWVRSGNILVTFTLTVIGFTFFRANSIGTIGDMCTAVFTNFHISVAVQFAEGYAMIVIAMAVGLFLHFSPHSWQQNAVRRYSSFPLLVQAIILTIVLFAVIQIRQSDLVPFIYLQY